MRSSVGLTGLCLLLLVACGHGDDEDSRLSRVREGRLPADNVIVYDDGVRQTLGLRILQSSGNFGPSGPTVVYVFRTIAATDAEILRRDGVVANEHTAYLLPPGTGATRDAMLQMQRIGSVEPSLTVEEIGRRFRLGEGAPRPRPAANTGDRSQLSNSRASEQVTSGAKRVGQRAAEKPGREKPAELSPHVLGDVRTVPQSEDPEIDAEVARLGLELNKALARLAAAKVDGDQTETRTRNVEDLQLQLAAVLAAKQSRSQMAAPEDEAPEDSSDALPLDPRRVDCAYVNRFGTRVWDAPAAREAMTAFATGFANSCIDYGICGASAFDADRYLEQLPAYCAENPGDSMQDSIAAHLCPEGLPRKTDGLR